LPNYYVAKSYQEWEIEGEVFEEKGRMYLKVRNPKGGTKQVRAYSETEYKRLYKETCASPASQSGVAVKTSGPNVKNILGFTEGYIWIFKGDLEHAEYWFERTPECRYHCQIGWYIVSTDTVPFDIPSCIQSIKLPWELIGNEDGTLKRKTDIENALCKIRADKESKSAFQGQVGQRLEISVKVDKVIDLEANQYGSVNHIHTFVDEKENVYIWNTASRRLNEGDNLRIRGTVKEHKNYQGVQQTIFTRCSIL
jgi:hypothetical protein